MKIRNLLANWFSKRAKAQPQQPSEVFEPKTAQHLGYAEEEMFAPQAFLTFFACYQAMKTKKPFVGNISMITMVDIFIKYPHGYHCTAFAIKGKNGYFWGKVGKREITYSLFKDFTFKDAEHFRIPIKEKIAAVCFYEKGQIKVQNLITQEMYPPTDGDMERWIGNKKDFPCSLTRAREIVERL